MVTSPIRLSNSMSMDINNFIFSKYLQHTAQVNQCPEGQAAVGHLLNSALMWVYQTV